MRSAAVAYAEQIGLPSEVRSVLANAPPSVAKAWAQHVQAPTEISAAPKRHKRTPPPQVNAPWATAALVEQIAAAARKQGDHPAEHQLLHQNVTDYEQLPGAGVNNTWVATLEDNTLAYHKSFLGIDEAVAAQYGQSSTVQPLHEVAAWRLARELGPPWHDLVPPCVLRNVEGELGSLAKHVPGVERNQQVGENDMRNAAFFDALVGQQDRHPENYLTDRDTLYLIDHGFCFAAPGDLRGQSSFVRHRNEIGDPCLRSYETDALARLLASTDTLGLQGLLEPRRAEALRRRASLMHQRNRILSPGEF